VIFEEVKKKKPTDAGSVLSFNLYFARALKIALRQNFFSLIKTFYCKKLIIISCLSHDNSNT
jgi:hypothetical protein